MHWDSFVAASGEIHVTDFGRWEGGAGLYGAAGVGSVVVAPVVAAADVVKRC